MTRILWRLEELSARASRVLADCGLEGDSRRVRWMPDSRTARFYTTLGLLDRPAEFRGRVALYGPRHLMQLVLIKRLQAAGHSLEEVQRRLAGLPAGELAAMARVPSEAMAPAPVPEPAPELERAPFWLAAPATPARDFGPAPATVPADAPPQRRARPMTALRLTDDATLLLDLPPGSLDEGACARLLEAAAPLVRALRAMTEPKDSKDD